MRNSKTLMIAAVVLGLGAPAALAGKPDGAGGGAGHGSERSASASAGGAGSDASERGRTISEMARAKTAEDGSGDGFGQWVCNLVGGGCGAEDDPATEVVTEGSLD